MVKDWWFRLRHRRSRAEIIAFAMGMRVGRELCVLIGSDETETLTEHVNEMMMGDYS